MFFLLFMCTVHRSKQVAEREDIKVDFNKAASNRILKEKDVKKWPKAPKTNIKEKEDEENVPLTPIEQDADHDTVQSTISLRK